jgi:siroheme synthase
MPKLQVALFKEILEQLEADQLQGTMIREYRCKIGSCTPYDVVHHAEVLLQEAFITGVIANSKDYRDVFVNDIAVKGHELLALMENKRIAERAEKLLGNSFEKATPGILLNALHTAMKQMNIKEEELAR